MTRETFIKELDKILKQANFIEELEKIKTEIDNLVYISYTMTGEDMFNIVKADVIHIINKHIEELKGDK